MAPYLEEMEKLEGDVVCVFFVVELCKFILSEVILLITSWLGPMVWANWSMKGGTEPSQTTKLPSAQPFGDFYSRI